MRNARHLPKGNLNEDKVLENSFAHGQDTNCGNPYLHTQTGIRTLFACPLIKPRRRHIESRISRREPTSFD